MRVIDDGDNDDGGGINDDGDDDDVGGDKR